MTDQSLRRTDDLLTELTELVETARSVPMSSNCIVGREHVLDLLDELREQLPADMATARAVIGNRGRILKEAHESAAATRERSHAEADAIISDARHQGAELLATAEKQSREMLQGAREEHARLVSNTGVHQAAAEAAAQLRDAADRYHVERVGAADEYDHNVRAEADRYALEARTEAELYAARLAGDARTYAERTLAEMVGTLQKAASTAEQGRQTLAHSGVPVNGSQAPLPGPPQDRGQGPMRSDQPYDQHADGDDGFSQAVLSA